ncbi:MAG: glycosyltransferase family 4 protein [Lentisphaeria bacterium]|nr:glycosyltransferase family 4 protein [Lentisphaeria bacterium]
MKKILCIGKYNGIVGGIERYIQHSAALLRRNNFAVHYLYTDEGGREQAAFASAFDSVGVFSGGNDLIAQADMVVIHNIIPPEYLKYLPAEKTFFFAHDHNIYCRRHHYYWPVGRINCHRKYNRFICKLCSLGRNSAPPLSEYRKLPALVLSDFMRDNLLKNGFEKVFKLPAFIKSVDKEHKFMPGNVLRILFLGQLIRGKGADLMLKTLDHLETVGIPFECTIAGDGNDRPMLETLVKKYDLQEKVHFTGFVSEPEKLWENCDLFFFPIRWQEPFGLVGLEAMAHGIPVVAFDAGGVREWLSERENGLLVPEKKTIAAAGVIGTLARTPELLAAMGKRGRKLAEEKFSEEEFVKKFQQLLELPQ